MNLLLSNSFTIDDITSADKAAYLEHLQEKQIYEQTLNIPYPYTQADADWWINRVADETAKQGRSVNWAIRRQDGYLVGGIGYHGLQVGKSHKAEIGYWLAKPYWGRGIMAEAVKRVVDFAFYDLGLIRITANVFDFNIGSTRVLEKSGFQLEGRLLKHYKKDGNIFNGKLYAKIKDDQQLAGELYKGMVIEESLVDSRILNGLKILGVKITNQEKPSQRWHIYTLQVSDSEIEELHRHLQGGKWYMHFWKGQEIIALFKEKRFKFSHSEKSEWLPALEYGRALGIPEGQLDFLIDGAET